MRLYNSKYYIDNKENILLANALWLEKHSVEIKTYRAKYYLDNKEECLAKQIEYNKTHKEQKAATSKKYQESHRAEASARHNNRKKSDLLYRLSCDLRSRLSISLKSKSWKKSTKFSDYIGCSLEELKAHIESQFQPGMTWNNRSRNGWHIDHIIPLASAKSVEEMIRLCHYSNLQPLWALENISKGARI